MVAGLLQPGGASLLKPNFLSWVSFAFALSKGFLSVSERVKTPSSLRADWKHGVPRQHVHVQHVCLWLNTTWTPQDTLVLRDDSQSPPTLISWVPERTTAAPPAGQPQSLQLKVPHCVWQRGLLMQWNVHVSPLLSNNYALRHAIYPKVHYIWKTQNDLRRKTGINEQLGTVQNKTWYKYSNSAIFSLLKPLKQAVNCWFYR